MAKISVIVPVYKVEGYLRRCVDSILSQTFTDFELILIDDGSPDRCGEICDEYQQRDKRVVVIHQSNGGLSAARNAGIEWCFENSNSSWFTFIDSDDWVHPEYLNDLLNAALEFQTKIIICRFCEATDENVRINESGNNEITTPEDFYDKNRINATVAWGKLYDRKCFEKIRYPQGKLHEDEFTTYKILFQYSYVAIVNKELYYYFRNSQGIMHMAWSDKRLNALEAHKEQICFFMERGLPRAYLRSIRAYVGAICNNCELLEKEKTHCKLKKKLKEELRTALKIYRAEVPFNECRWAYVVAYPRLTRFYSCIEMLIKGIWRRIHG